jgi:D-glycero-alpha-D-manno-heptose-7-phosphate kinase
MKKIRARAPLRLGLAGGGTDLSPYCDQHGGNVLNYTIGVYARAIIEECPDWRLRFVAADMGETDETVPLPELPTSEGLALHRGVYNRIIRQFNGGRPIAVTVISSCDAPPGSGLGSSSALVVALVKGYAELFGLPLGDYDIAHLAYEIERVELGMAGGRQDQYAAAFGGCNFIEFLPGDRVIVNPLRIHEAHRLELESSLVVCHTGRSRASSDIAATQQRNLEQGDEDAFKAMHQLKQEAIEMKLCLLNGDFQGIAEVLSRSWNAKKQTAAGVSNDTIERVYDTALSAGALAGKISGAGGGGYLLLLTPPERRHCVVDALIRQELTILSCPLTERGAESWAVKA